MGVREIGIMFKAPLVRSIVEDRKTVTRRIGPGEYREGDSWGHRGGGAWERMRRVGKWTESEVVQCRYGDVGSRLWVRETWACPGDGSVVYRADHGDRFDAYDIHPDFRAMNPDLSWKWKSSMFMPRWASRLTLEVTSVGVERLWDISEEQAVAEGVAEIYPDPASSCQSRFEPLLGVCPCPSGTMGNARECFELAWRATKGDASWESNPWVWVLEFAIVENDSRKGIGT